MSIKHLLSSSSSCHTKFHNYPHSFVFSCPTTNLFSTSSPMHISHHLFLPPITLITQVSPMNSPYQPPALHANLRSQPYTFPIPINNTHVWPFPHLLHHLPQLFMIKPCNLPPFLQHSCNFHLQPFAPIVGVNWPFKG